MTLNDLIQPFEGDVYRHVPLNSAIPVNDFRYAGLGRDNRWNHPGQRTLYLAHDHAAALAEWARHVEQSYNPETDLPLQRRLYRLKVSLPAVLDLRDARVWGALGGVISDLSGFLEIPHCRAVADYVRALTDAVAIHVPSIAFIDDLQRGNLVVFLDKLPDDQTFIRKIVDCGGIGYQH
ncbi:MAG TPA: RES domain-containing protein [Chloroflexota bacterium]|nr:RES domain-containing protein [Chloroflexota bacterium]